MNYPHKAFKTLEYVANEAGLSGRAAYQVIKERFDMLYGIEAVKSKDCNGMPDLLERARNGGGI